MSAQSKKSMGWAVVLMTFGLAAFFAGTKVLVVSDPGSPVDLVRDCAADAE